MGLLILSILLILRVKRENKYEMMTRPKRSNSSLVKKLYEGMRSHGLDPVLGYKVDRYAVDLAFPELKIAIEAVEYRRHPKDMERESWEKESYLKHKGWTILRFSGARIDEDLPRVVERVSRELISQSHSS